MEQFLKEGGHVLHAVFLAFKGSRFNWHLTAGKAFLLNHAWLLTFMHTLMVCVDKPNRLVLAVFDILSNRYCMAALAARCILDVELISPMQFALKGLATRWEQRAIYDAAIDTLLLGLPRGAFISSVRELAPEGDVYWQSKVDSWVQSQADLVSKVHAHSEPYAKLWPCFHKQGLPHMIEALKAYMDPSDQGDEEMKLAPTSTCLVEGGFGCVKDINVVSRNCDIWNNWGQALCTMSGFYLTAGERLSRERAHRKSQHLPKMSMEDEVDFLNQDYMLGVEVMTNVEEELLYKMAHRKVFPITTMLLQALIPLCNFVGSYIFQSSAGEKKRSCTARLTA